MPSRRSKAEVGKENGLEQIKDVDMAGAKKGPGKREANGKPVNNSKKPRKAAESAEDTSDADRVGSGRQAAQNLQFQEKQVRLDRKTDKLTIKEEIKCSTEKSALLDTDAGVPSIKTRRLGDFSITDGNGNLEPIEALQFSSGKLFISGVIYPSEGPTNKDLGRRVDKFGPLKSFGLDLTGKSALVQLLTDNATYTLLRPAATYKKVYSNLPGQADIVYEVYQALNAQNSANDGGNGPASVTVEEIIARLARSRVTKGFSTTPREGLLLNGKFVLAQLGHLDAGSGPKDFKYTETEFAKELTQALVNFKYVGAQGAVASHGGVVIRDISRDGAKSDGEKAGEDKDDDAQMVADEDFARQLQAKMDAELNGSYRNASAPKHARPYIKVSEAEIADDYPAPLAYNKEEEETDEFIFFDEEFVNCDPDCLPRRLLTDFSIYNVDGLMSSLELLPMWSGIESDVELYASGVVVDDDGDFSGGQTLDGAAAAAAGSGAAGGSSGAGGSGSGSSAAGASTAAAEKPEVGMRMYLSQIREWIVEFGADMIFISLRTDIAWYRVSVPSQKYAPWFDVVLKTARLASHVLGMLSEESRASKLSFADIVKRLTKEEESSPLFISKRVESVERFLTVHGQILLNCFENYPVDSIRRSAFASTLHDRMAAVRHSKLYSSTSAANKSKSRSVNRNPMRDRAAGARSKPMTATATTMVKSIWQAYFIVSSGQDDGAAAAADGAATTDIAQEVEEDVNEEDNEEEKDVEENALAENTSPVVAVNKKKAAARPSTKKRSKKAEATFIGAPFATDKGIKYYKSFSLDSKTISLGDAIELDDAADDENEEEEEEVAPTFGLVQALYQDKNNKKWVQVLVLVRGVDTVLGDAASSSELFVTTDVENYLLTDVVSPIQASHLKREWNASRRTDYFKEDSALRERNEEAKKEGKPLEYFWRRQYVPQKGMFCDLPTDMKFGKKLPADDDEEEEEDDEYDSDDSAAIKPKSKKGKSSSSSSSAYATKDGQGFIKDGITYSIGDYIFVGPEVFDQMDDAKRDIELPEYLKSSRFHKGSHIGLRAWGIGRLVKLGAAGSKKTKENGGDAHNNNKKRVTSITVQRFWRPEDISEETAYKASSYYDIYASEEHITVDTSDVVGPVNVVPEGGKTDIHTFACIGSFERKGKTFGPAPDFLSLSKKGKKIAGRQGGDKTLLDVDDGKGKASNKKAAQSTDEDFPGNDGIALSTMDIFAGCGGLSEGMHQAGAAYTKWAIEYEKPAADAFKLNNDAAAVFCDNCNVLLHAAMVKGGNESDCLASEEAIQASTAMKPEDRAALPLPGDVDFICGGPPCQGYSGMNRFNKGNWSMVQNSMVMSFLSYADFYRPRYFLLENVRNFVSHNKSFTFRLTVRSLLDMGYQVRFGVLNAGNFGVSQSRKRTFIWAAAPGELLPDWPALMHCFRTPQLTINLPGNVQYTAVPQTDGAPLRPVTVRDAIGDLPQIQNGHDNDAIPYTNPPHSAFQRAIRGDCDVLYDHISKNMNELNLERCKCIPINCPGADWRVLEEIVKQDPSREKFKGQPLVPWCLPNTADRHNGWRGLFGRLDWSGHFPTSTTDPQPMGKVGQVFHPEQHRIVSVRECARAQGFPDKHKFSGNVHNKHRQVGNAVPPPLAAALGRELRKVLEVHAEEMAKATLAAQMDF